MMNPNSPETIFVGDSKMARLMRSHDWSQTLLGVVSNWASSLKTAVSICLNSRFPMVIWWGKDLVLLYNDAWRPILGTKHPKALGRPGREVWAEIWDIIGVQLHSVLETAQATWSDDMLLPVDRYGYTEEAYFTYSYSPIFLETGEVGGAFTAVTETTRRVIGERRLGTLRELAANTVEAKSVEETCQIASATLANNSYDIPFALLYLVEMDGKAARLVQRVRIEAGTATSPEQVDLTQEQDCWNLAQVKTTGNAKIIDELSSRFGQLSGGAWEEPSRSAIVLPIAQAGQKEQLAGLLVLGISPRREFDDEYRGFFDLVASNVATAISNAYAYEEERKRAESLAELDRAKTTFFSNISHEFRTPLTLMLNPLEHTLAKSDSLAPDDREQLEIAYRNSQRLLKLVNTLLDFSRIEAGRIQAVYEPTDLATLTADLAGVFRSAIERAGMRLQVDCPPLPEPVYVDREMWEKIVLNLLSNAFKFTFEGEIGISLRAVAQQIELKVRDTGTGIPAEELPHIFERFHRVKGARGRSYEGSGIGLALVQELVRLHSGTIQVNSVVDQGTCFTVAIPMGFAHLPRECIGVTRTLASTATGAMPYVEEMLRWSSKSIESSDALASELSISIPARSQVSSTPTARILLADDNADLRDYLKRLLSQQYKVETVADGNAVLSAIRQQMPDLVLTDVMMPEMDGFELLRSLRSDPTTQDIPIILLSARAGEEARIEGLEAGADDYLTKPFSARELLARVEANLKLAQLRRETTQREQALNQQLRRRINELQTLFDLLPIGVAIAEDPECRMIRFNPYLSELTRVPINANASQSASPEERPLYRLCREGTEIPVENLPMQYAAAHNIEVRDEVIDIVHPDGTVIKLLCYCSPLWDEQGNVRGVLGAFVDATQRVLAEIALRESEERLKLAMEAGRMVAWEWKPSENTIITSSNFPEIYGLSEIKTAEQGFALVHPGDRTRHQMIVENTVATGGNYLSEFRFIRPDNGAIIWLEERGQAILNSDGSLQKLIGITIDMTDRKQAEEARTAAEQRYRIVSDLIPFGIWEADLQGNATYLSPLFLEMTGQTLEEHRRTWHTLLHPDDTQVTIEAWYNCVQTGSMWEHEFRIRGKDGHYRTILARGLPVRNTVGEITSYVGANYDITERKQAEEALRRSEERVRLAMEGAQMGTWDVDLTTGEAVWSELHFTMLGYEPVSTGEATEAMWSSRIHPDDLERVVQEWQQARQERRFYQTEYRVVRADNQQIAWLAGLGSFNYNQNAEAIRSLGILFDVTDRKQTELMLIEQKQLLELIATGHSLDECLSAICTSVSRLNPHTRACVLLTDAERLTFPRSITPDFSPSFGQGLKNAPINELCIGTCGEAVYCGEPVTCADIANDDRWSQEWRDLCVAHGILACHSSPIFGLDGLPLGSLMLCFNEARMPTDWEYQLANFGTQVASIVFERDRSSLALRESEARFRNMADNAPFMVWMTDPTGYCTYLSQSWYDFSGQTPEIGLGYGWLNAVHPDDQESARVTFLAANDRRESFQLEYRLRRKDGEYIWAIDAAAPWFGEDGHYKGYVGSVIDISDRKQIEVALQQNEDRLRLAIEAAQLGTWDWNLSTNELLLDEVGKTMFGLLPEAEASFEDCFERLHPDDRERLKQVVQWSLNPASGGTYDAEYRTLSLQDGAERWIKAKGQVYFDPAGHPRRFIGTLLDITQQKRAETEREQLLAREQAAREAAEAANRIKDEFLAVVSHELRSPLNPILGWSKLLRSRQLNEEKTDRALEVIERNAQMQAQLINDLLDVSRILRGKLSLDTQPVDLVTTIQAAMETVRLAAEAKSIQINTQFEPDVGQVAGDAGRLQQVIWNLLTNAVKFTSEGGRVDIRLERTGSQAQITITDTGKGIPPDFLPYVFEQFRQESSATTRRFGGLGLGLAIVRYLVELHGGTVQADSLGEGQGATFTVKLPLMPHQPITKPNPKPSEFSLNLQGTRILVVDDDDNTREFLAFLLELHGANVIATATAGEALTTLTQFKPDMLLSDIGMPDVDGYMLMRQVRALPPKQGGTIPAIALTAYAGEIDYQQAMAAGFQRHIAKPIEPEVLIQAIATLLRQTAPT